MESKIFNSLEIDAIGEILNISLGASATAVSTMLSRRVDITIPTVMVSNKESFEFSYMEPAVGVEIYYISGLSGKNIMLLKQDDVRVIVEILMGTEIPPEEFELNDLYLSAVREVMNQMMGASSTALSELLGEVVNISTPTSYEINTVTEFKEKYLSDEEEMVVISFSLKIEDAVESEFLNIMTIDLAKKLLSAIGFNSDSDNKPEENKPEENKPEENKPSNTQPQGGGLLSQDEIEKLLSGAAQNVQSQTPEPEISSGKSLSQDEIEKLLAGTSTGPQNVISEPEMPSGRSLSQDEIERLLNGGIEDSNTLREEESITLPNETTRESYQTTSTSSHNSNTAGVYDRPPNAYSEPKVISVKPLSHMPIDEVDEGSEERPENLELIMDVALDISVEIGRTKKYVKEILEYNQGSLIVLDKLAGEQVDVFVNGRCIAKGDVVVVDDCFGVRITEVLKKV